MGKLRTELSQAYEKEHYLDLYNLLFQINLLDSLKLLYEVDKNIRCENCPKGKGPCFDGLKEPCADDVVKPLLTGEIYAINKGNIECHRIVIDTILKRRDEEMATQDSGTIAEEQAA